MRVRLFFAFAFCWSSAFAAGEKALIPELPGPLRPLLTESPPVIDGDLSDPVWQRAPHFTGFVTYAPAFDRVPKEQTDVALAYDRENLYFAFRCFDDPAAVKASVSPRDQMTSDDFICVNLDAFNDRQSLTAFYVNPLGIQGDSRFTAGNEDFSPDFVWYSAGRIDSLGYTVEVRIPVKSLRYSGGDTTTMEIVLERYISRRVEHSTYPRLDPAKGSAFLTQMTPVVYPGIDRYRLVEILPAVTATRQDVRNGNVLERSKEEASAGLTAKYGITPDLILDGTVNPDFSQVESDAGQIDVNLRSSLYYPEKRPFFLEGIEHFATAANAGVLDPTIYYSRTITDPDAGAKLTGKIGGGNTVAALFAEDNVLDADRPLLGDHIAVPVVRLRHSLGDEDSYAGFMAAARELSGTHNRVAGADEQFRLSKSTVLESNAFLSWTKDDPRGEVAAGNTFGVRYAGDDRSLGYSLSARGISENFRADMGYVARPGVLNFTEYLNPRLFPEESMFQRIGFEFTTGQTLDRPSGLWEWSNDAAANLYFWGSWYFRTRLNYSTEVFAGERFRTSGAHLQFRSQFTKRLFLNITVHTTQAIYYPAAEQGRSTSLIADLLLQPWENLQAEGTLTYAEFTADGSGLLRYSYGIERLRLLYQPNPFLFFRAIGEYNAYYGELTTDLLASFTYIPGTAVYLGYGSVFDRVRWDGTDYVPGPSLVELQRGLFMKLSYLWRS